MKIRLRKLIALSILLGGCSASQISPELTAPEVLLAITETSDPPADRFLSSAPTITALPFEEATPPSQPATLVKSPAVGSIPVKGIILFIGDGMGMGQRKAAQWLAAGQEGLLAMDQLEVKGVAQTAAYQRPITDLAAAATAMASGVQTRYGVVGVDKDYQPVTTILEQAKAHGWSVGLVTTVQLSHATPAAFAAHVSDRDNMLEIARQYIAAEVDVLLGGGEDEFLPGVEKGCYPEPGERGDGSNLVAQAQSVGYRYVCTAEELASVEAKETTKLLGLFADEELERPYSPSLIDLTTKAVEILSQNPYGFFLMVEGGQIDWAGHANDAAWAMEAALSFDSAIAYGLSVAALDGNILVIVSADHETGGMTVDQNAEGSYRMQGPFTGADGQTFYVDWTTGSHTHVDVPVTAQGPYADQLRGTYHLTHIYDVMFAAMLGK